MLPPFHTGPVKLLRHMREHASRDDSGYLGTCGRDKKKSQSPSMRREAWRPLFPILQWGQLLVKHELPCIALGSSGWEWVSGGDGITSWINYCIKHEVWFPILWGRETLRTPGLK